MVKSPSSTSKQNDTSDVDLDDDIDLMDTDMPEGDDWVDDMETEVPAVKKKKGGMTNLIIIIFGVFAFVGIIYFQMMATQQQPSGSSTPPSSITAGQNTTQPTAEGRETVPVDATAQTSNGTTPETGPLTPMPEPADDIPPQPATTTTPTVPGVDIVPPVTTLTPNDRGDLEATEATETSGITKEPVPNTDVMATDMPQTPASKVTIPDLSVQDSSSLQPSSESKDTIPPVSDVGMSPLPPTLSPTPNNTPTDIPPGVPDVSQKAVGTSNDDLQKIADLTGQVKTLSDRIIELEQQLETTRTAPSRADPVPNITIDTEKDVSVQSDMSGQSDKPDEPVVKQQVKKYVLRAVSSGTAYVAPSQTAPVMAVRMGDMIPGHGKVKDIRSKGAGKWQVVTTGGIISSR